MRTRLLPAVMLSLLLALACTPSPEPEPAEEPAAPETVPVDQEAAFDEVRALYQEAFNDGDAAAVAGLFAADAWYLPADGSINRGLEAIQANLEQTMTAGSPTVMITTDETAVMGDWAMSRGAWSMDMAPEGGELMSVGGHYMTAFQRVDGEWKIGTLITNYDAAPPEMMPAAEMPAERLPDLENNPVAGLTAAYMDAYGAGDAVAVAALYTEDAVAAYADNALAVGRAAIEGYVTAAMAELGSPQLTIHTIGAEDLGDGRYGAGGWYEITSDSGPRQGQWLTLVVTAEDGSQRIEWSLTNAIHAGM